MCGIVGMLSTTKKNVGVYIYDALTIIQHRGQDAAGITTACKGRFYMRKGNGMVRNVFRTKHMTKLIGDMGIGHIRYPTAGSSSGAEAQPFYVNSPYGIAFAHNGNLCNARHLRRDLVKNGSIFQTTSDTETIVQLIAKSKRSKIIDKIIDSLFRIQGGYALTILINKKLIGIRDPFGIRPLVIGKLNKSYVLASETCAFDIIGAKFIREVENGEIVIITENGLESIKPFPKVKARPCIFEYIYFSRPDSIINNISVYEYRKRLGAELARESNLKADLVIPVPDSGVPAAIGYSEEIKSIIELGIIRNHYVGRTFIEPSQQIRSLGVKLKLSINKPLIKNKTLILIDDSLVRGTTSVKIIKMLYESGAKEVHLKIACPPIKYPDYYGIDTPNKDELLASKLDLKGMQKFINAKTLQFLSIEGLYKSMGYETRNSSYPQFADHCFTGDYPVKPIDVNDKNFEQDQLSFMSSKFK